MTRLNKVGETIIGLVIVGVFIALAKIYGYWILSIPAVLIAIFLFLVIKWISHAEKDLENLKTDRRNRITTKWEKRKESRSK
jgi:MFS superfamily sulfate permease-like transporter